MAAITCSLLLADADPEPKKAPYRDLGLTVAWPWPVPGGMIQRADHESM